MFVNYFLLALLYTNIIFAFIGIYRLRLHLASATLCFTIIWLFIVLQQSD